MMNNEIEPGVKVGPIMQGGLVVPAGYVGLPTAESGYVILPLEEYKKIKTDGALAKYDSTRGQ
jgi:hypothetical protein